MLMNRINLSNTIRVTYDKVGFVSYVEIFNNNTLV